MGASSRHTWTGARSPCQGSTAHAGGRRAAGGWQKRVEEAAELSTAHVISFRKAKGSGWAGLSREAAQAVSPGDSTGAAWGCRTEPHLRGWSEGCQGPWEVREGQCFQGEGWGREQGRDWGMEA